MPSLGDDGCARNGGGASFAVARARPAIGQRRLGHTAHRHQSAGSENTNRGRALVRRQIHRGSDDFGTTDDTPPIKLPDYIYGNVGATYTYKSLSFDLRFHGTTLSRQSCFLITGTGSPAGSNGCQPTIVGTMSWNGALSELKSAFGAGK